jgi:hypothetical protein
MAGLVRQLLLMSPMMRGDDVLMLQKRLQSQDPRLEADGLFGEECRTAVLAFQQSTGLHADGTVGPATWAKLFPTDGAPSVAMPDLGMDAVLSTDALNALKVPHSRYSDSCLWQLTPEGLSVRNRDNSAPGFVPAPQEVALATQVLKNFLQPLASVLSKPQSNVPIELIVACICTESGGNPRALRREPGCDTTDFDRTPTRASTGLMQTLVSTARSALNEPTLTGEDLMSPEKSIQAGATYIFIQARGTLFDPPLVAASYNAGGIYYEGTAINRWRLRQYPIGTPNHVDRFTRYFNGAFKALGEVALPESVPSFKRLLAA